MRNTIWIFALGCVFVACNTGVDGPVTPDQEGSNPAQNGDDAIDQSLGLPIVHDADVGAAARGESYFKDTTLASASIPLPGLRNLWFIWGGTAPATEAGYWAAFRERYGMLEAPFDNGGYPLGIRVEGNNALIDCLACHAGEVAGEVYIGAANSRFDMQGLYSDMSALASLGGISPSFELQSGTGSAGANDAWGLGMKLAQSYNPPPEGSTLNQDFGYQRPAAWWTLKYKDRMYHDASASSDGHRTMMAMLLAYGVTLDEFAELDTKFEDLKAYLWSLSAPSWTTSPIDTATATEGLGIFNQHCASCHGVHSGQDAEFPNIVVDADTLGTDPLRAKNFRQDEADYLNSFQDGTFSQQSLLSASGGYLAQPLVGIWARAPYFHNGSVPDLLSVLDSSQRPQIWRRTGSGLDDFDRERVGWKYTTPDSATNGTIAARKTYDTSLEGLSNAGHTYGDSLVDDERMALLEYLKTL